MAAKWSGVYINLPKVNKNQIHIFSITIFSCKMKSSILKSSIFNMPHSFVSRRWTLLLKLKILKLVLDVLHFILLPLCGCFTNKFIIKTRKSLVVLICFVLFWMRWQLFSKIYKFSWILAIPFSLEEVVKGITPCEKVTWFVKLVKELHLLTFTSPWPCAICLLYCKIWLLPPLEIVKISFYKG